MDGEYGCASIEYACGGGGGGGALGRQVVRKADEAGVSWSWSAKGGVELFRLRERGATVSTTK